VERRLVVLETGVDERVVDSVYSSNKSDIWSWDDILGIILNKRVFQVA
jgi:hypothetical protein